jgi:hypothetical protein
VIEGKSGKGNLGLSDLSSVISAAVSLWDVLNVVFGTCDRTDGFVLMLLL